LRGARRSAAWLLGGAIATSGVLAARNGRAFHTDEQRVTDDSAYTLRKHDVRLGIWKVQYGVVPQVTLGTYVWPWLIRVSNLEGKWRFYQSDPWAFAVSTGFFYFDTKSLKKADESVGDARIAAFPFEIDGSYRFESPFTLSMGLVWTSVLVNGTINRDALQGAGKGAVSNFQVTGTLEWRASEVTALELHGRYLVFQQATANGDAVLHPDEFTTVEVHAGAKTDAINYRGAGSLTASAVWSYQTFNLRAGIGYGHYNVAGVNFVIGNRIVYPELDVYWIF
jgi:hypothetical protein